MSRTISYNKGFNVPCFLNALRLCFPVSVRSGKLRVTTCFASGFKMTPESPGEYWSRRELHSAAMSRAREERVAVPSFTRYWKLFEDGEFLRVDGRLLEDGERCRRSEACS